MSKSDSRIIKWGKSELYRVECWLTASEGDLKDSATEINRRKGKGGKVR